MKGSCSVSERATLPGMGVRVALTALKWMSCTTRMCYSTHYVAALKNMPNAAARREAVPVTTITSLSCRH
ncbi:MAG TPA: hypothetical protein K8U78_03210 [Aeriscardovia aeriphila]|uniref:Uncharacterized protein n=1 Tax=Aeriscardovia aeriphila TaxID=218139 RepID=A0A921FVK4_9BIFI|nr:hypothetical protein [Aeriscardovia aeriphila]